MPHLSKYARVVLAVATASDDCTWKIWQLPSGELVMSGKGHQVHWHTTLQQRRGGGFPRTRGPKSKKGVYIRLPLLLQEWLGCVAFHPRGSLLVSTSGDATAKVWSITEEKCLHTFNDHTRPVWSCSFHDQGKSACRSGSEERAALLVPSVPNPYLLVFYLLKQA